MGPNLRGIVGKKAATRVGYAYSSALKRSNVIWDTSKLDQWLAGPGRMVPGTRMVQNVPNPVDRAAIVKYLSLLR
jgi:cytochrome c